jgi:ribosome-binding protein aMBF1 (putative translation factor)
MTNNKQQTEINAVEYLSKVNQFAKENNTDKPRQQTAVDWLWEIAYNRELTVEDWKQAKAMHKEEIEQTYDDAIMKGRHQDGMEYYNEKFGGKK